MERQRIDNARFVCAKCGYTVYTTDNLYEGRDRMELHKEWGCNHQQYMKAERKRSKLRLKTGQGDSWDYALFFSIREVQRNIV